MLACHMCLCIRHLELLFTHFKPREGLLFCVFLATHWSLHYPGPFFVAFCLKASLDFRVILSPYGLLRCNLMQFLFHGSYNFKIAHVKQLRLQCDCSAIYRRDLRCNLRNTVTLSISFTFEQAHSFCLRNRCALTLCTNKLHQNCNEIAAGCKLSAFTWTER